MASLEACESPTFSLLNGKVLSQALQLHFLALTNDSR